MAYNPFTPDAKASGSKTSASSGGGKSFNPFADAGGQATPSGGGHKRHGIGGLVTGVIGRVVGSAPVRTALEAIDTPRAALVSLDKELTDKLNGRQFSLHDLVQQTKDHYGFGQYLSDTTNLGINQRRVLGLAGDIAFDPLTYLSGGAEAVAKVGGEMALKEGTRLGYKQVAERALKLGEKGLLDDSENIANNVLKNRTAAFLDQGTKDALGIDTRMHFGLNKIGGGDLRVAIPHSEVVSKLRAIVTNRPLDWVGRTGAADSGAKLVSHLGEKFVELKKANPAKAVLLTNAERESRVIGEGLTETSLKGLEPTYKMYRKLDRTLVGQLVEDPELRAAAVAAGRPEGAAATALGGWYEQVRQAAETASGRTIPKIEDYLPHKLRDEFKAAVDAMDHAGSKAPGFTQRRMYRGAVEGLDAEGEKVIAAKGSMWFGEELQHGTIKEMEDIAKQHLGADYIQMFEHDPWKLAQDYAHSVGRMVGDHRFLKELEGRGLTRYFNAEGLDAAVAHEKKLVQRSAKLDKNAGQLVDKAAAKEAKAAGLAAPVVDEQARLDAEHAAMAAHDAATAEAGTVDALNAEGTDLASSIEHAPAAPSDAALQQAHGQLAAAVAEHQAAQVAPVAEAAVAEVSPHAAALDKINATMAEGEKYLKELDAQKVALTRAEAAGGRAADESLAKLARLVAPTQSTMKVDGQALVDALMAHGSEKLANLGEEIQAVVTERVGASREQLRSLDAELKSLQTAARQKVAEVAGEAKNLSPELRSVNNKIGRIQAKLQSLSADQSAAQLALKESGAAVPAAVEAAAPAVDHTVVSAAEKKVTQARQAVDTEQRAFDAMSTVHANWDSHVSQVESRMSEIEQEIKSASTRERAHLADEAKHLAEADTLAKAANGQSDKTLKEIAKLESAAAAQRADAERMRLTSRSFDAVIRRMNVPERQAEMAAMHADGLFKQLTMDPTRWADPEVAKVIEQITAKTTPKQVGHFLGTYDSLLGRWKAYSLLSPGFHVRNFLGGHWNNWMADVGTKVNFDFASAVSAYKKGGLDAVEKRMGKAGAQWRDIFTEAERLNVWGHGNIHDFTDIGHAGSGGLVGATAKKLGMDVGKDINKLDPTSLDFLLLSKNMDMGHYVEKMLRGPLFADRILKGFSAEEAMAAVIKYHFDYSELSQLEKTVGKRLFPFYTWSRKNFPLQIENFARNPGKFNRYLDLKRSMELGVPDNPNAPAYYKDILGMRTPFQFGENPLYLTPDLPITRVGDSPDRMFKDSLTPFIKLPAELWANKSSFTGFPLLARGEDAKPMPLVFQPLAPLLFQLDGALGLPKVERRKGHWYMNRREAYKVESALPGLGRLRRLVPSEQRYKDRYPTTLLSTLAGVNSRTLTPDDIKQEMARRNG